MNKINSFFRNLAEIAGGLVRFFRFRFPSHLGNFLRRIGWENLDSCLLVITILSAIFFCIYSRRAVDYSFLILETVLLIILTFTKYLPNWRKNAPVAIDTNQD